MTEQENQAAYSAAFNGGGSETPEQDQMAPQPSAPVSFRMVGNLAPLFAAKAKARLGFRPIVKNRTVKVNPPNSASYTFDYATLDSVRDSCDGALAENGLDIFHAPADEADARVLRTFLSHASGAFLECVVVIPAIKQTKDGPKPLTIQEVGSAMTYWERYSYVALAGVASEHDDDGNAADGNQVQSMATRDRSKPQPHPQARGRGQARAGADAQSSKPAEETSGRPQDAPGLVQDPKGTRVAEATAAPPPSSTAAKAEGKPDTFTPDQLKELGGLFRQGPPVGPWGRADIDALLLNAFGKTHAEMGAKDGDQLVILLKLSQKMQYTPAQLLSFLPEYSTAEKPDAASAIRALDAEDQAFGGAS